MDELTAGLLAVLAIGVGTVGGLGGAVLLVPALVLTGVPAADAAPLGLISVGAGSLAAAAPQLTDRAVNHRLGVTVELVASTGAVAGALVSGSLSDTTLTRILAVTAFAAAFAGGRRSGVRNPTVEGWTRADVGERVGSLTGAYPLVGGVAPYAPTRLGVGLAAMSVAGLVAGTSGASGGFVKTPAMSEIMHVPVRVAAATTTFTVGITSAAALLVFAAQGRVDASAAAAVILGSLVGGRVGAALQSRLPPTVIRKGLSVVLVTVAVVLAVRG